MAKNKIYAVRCGRRKGLFNTWAECEAQVRGFAGAVYKGFASSAEASAWLWGQDKAEPVQEQTRKPVQSSLFAAAEPQQTGYDYIVYTDGSCLRNPDGPGGYAAVLLKQQDGSVQEICGGEPSTTNNRMELRAAIEALRAMPQGVKIQLNTDSRYLRDAIEKFWLRAWKRKGWITSTGTAVKNRDLWEALDEQLQLRRAEVTFCWVKGHAGQEYNERRDRLAKGEAMKNAR